MSTHQMTNNFYTKDTMKEIYKNVPGAGIRLMNLVETIPNWETYLTEKQLEVTQIYVRCLNATEVDYKLDLRVGTTQQRLFGTATSKGALGKLEEVSKRLNVQGYFEKQKRIQETKPKLAKKRLSEDTKNKVKELFQLITEIENYEQYLTSTQNERLQYFLEVKSIAKCSHNFEVTEVTFKQSLFGRNKGNGILEKLKKAKKETLVNSWDDI